MRNALITLLLVTGVLFGQGFKIQKYDALDSQQGDFIKYDKAEHLIGSFLLSEAMGRMTGDWKTGASLALLVGLTWELHDGWYSDGNKERTQGFSIYDMGANLMGIAINAALHDLFDARKAAQKDRQYYRQAGISLLNKRQR